jgi:hypothetical protein
VRHRKKQILTIDGFLCFFQCLMVAKFCTIVPPVFLVQSPLIVSLFDREIMAAEVHQKFTLAVPMAFPMA